MTTITMPKGKPDAGTVFFVYRAKLATGSSIHTAGAITADQHRAIAMILQGQSTTYDGRADTTPAYQNALAALAATE